MKAAIGILLLLGAFGFVGSMDYADALTVDAIRKDLQFPARLVIPYDALVCQDSGGKPRCRWYVSGTTRKEIK